MNRNKIKSKKSEEVETMGMILEFSWQHRHKLGSDWAHIWPFSGIKENHLPLWLHLIESDQIGVDPFEVARAWMKAKYQRHEK